MRSAGDTSSGAPRRDDTTLGSALVASASVLIVVLTAVSAVGIADRSWDVARTRGEAAAEQLAVSVSAGIAEASSAVDAISRDPTRAQAGDSPPASLRTIGVLWVDGPAPEERDLETLSEDPAARVALARARDSGRLVLSAPTDTSPAVTVIVRALYSSDDGVRNEATGQTTTARRAELAGHVVGVIDAEALAGEPRAFRISDNDAVLAGPAELPAPTVDAEVPVLGRRWRVSNAFAPPSHAIVWLVLALGAAASIAVLAATRSWRTALRTRATDAGRAEERAEAVVAYAGVVQESHDLGAVLPALAVQLEDRLGLAGISLSVVSEEGVLREIFVHGDAPDPVVTPVSLLPATARYGETVAVHLRRAERPVGILRVRCGELLGSSDFDEVRIVGELVTATVVATRSSEQQQEAVDRLRALDELKTAFLGTASHELRTPVTAITGFASMLSGRWETLSDENRRVFADRIASNARVLEALVQDLLDFARLERGELQVTLEAVDLSLVTDRVLDRLAPVWSSHTVNRSITPSAVVSGDVVALERIVTNLVSNAVKFSPNGSAVTVRVEDGPMVRLSVDDEGPGVPAVERDRIFVRFFRGRGDEVLRTGGVGIGLSVVQDYVKRMGGRVHVGKSTSGGARFVVELRRAQQQQRQEQENSDATT